MNPNKEQFPHTRTQQNVDQFSHFKVVTAPDGGSALVRPGGDPATEVMPRITEMGGDEIARAKYRRKLIREEEFNGR